MARATSEGQEVWEAARATGDFAAFAPVLGATSSCARLRRLLRRRGVPYDALLADYDFGLTAGRLHESSTPRRGCRRSSPGRPSGRRRAGRRSRPARSRVPPCWRHRRRRRRLADRRLRPPVQLGVGRGDSRITTRYVEGDLLTVLAALHEFGHALYERQIAPELSRTSLGGGTSMSVHESQSKLWENHVGRHPAFAPVLAECVRRRRLPGRARRVLRR